MDVDLNTGIILELFISEQMIMQYMKTLNIKHLSEV